MVAGSSLTARLKNAWTKVENFPGYCEVPEQHQVAVTLTSTTSNLTGLIKKFSLFDKLKQVVCNCLRFLYNASHTSLRKFRSFSVQGINAAETSLIRKVQHEKFSEELHVLSKRKLVKSCNSISQLSPLLDDSGLIRAG